MKQLSFSDVEYSLCKRMTKREEFLRAMDEFIPWEEWVAYIEPYYPKGQRGRPPMGIEKMLRMYDTMVAFENSDSTNQVQTRANLNLLQSHLREIDGILGRLEKECPMDLGAAADQEMGCVSPGWLGG